MNTSIQHILRTDRTPSTSSSKCTGCVAGGSRHCTGAPLVYNSPTNEASVHQQRHQYNVWIPPHQPACVVLAVKS